MEGPRRTRGRTKRRRFGAALSALFAVILIAGGVGLFAISSAQATGGGGSNDSGQVCSGLDSGKIDVSGEKTSITVTAPDGKLISGYCVKAGSAGNGDGPRYVTLSSPQKTVTLTYESTDGTVRALSHYSLSFVDEGSGGGGVVNEEVTPTVVFDNPSCADTDASWKGYVNGTPDTANDGVTFAVTSGTVAPGATATITATAETGFEFAGGMTTKTFNHTFTALPTGCTGSGVSAPGGSGESGVDSNSPAVTVAGPKSAVSGSASSGTVPTVVEAGLAGAPAPTNAFEAQLARGMVLAGLALLVASVLTSLKRRGGAHRA